MIEHVGALIGAIFSTTIYIPATTSACPVTRTSSACVKTGALVPAAPLSLDAFFVLFAVATLVQNDWLATRTGQELSSWAQMRHDGRINVISIFIPLIAHHGALVIIVLIMQMWFLGIDELACQPFKTVLSKQVEENIVGG